MGLSLGLDDVMRLGVPVMGLAFSYAETRVAALCPCRDPARRKLSASRKESPRQEPDHAGTPYSHIPSLPNAEKSVSTACTLWCLSVLQADQIVTILDAGDMRVNLRNMAPPLPLNQPTQERKCRPCIALVHWECMTVPWLQRRGRFKSSSGGRQWAWR